MPPTVVIGTVVAAAVVCVAAAGLYVHDQWIRPLYFTEEDLTVYRKQFLSTRGRQAAAANSGDIDDRETNGKPMAAKGQQQLFAESGLLHNVDTVLWDVDCTQQQSVVMVEAARSASSRPSSLESGKRPRRTSSLLHHQQFLRSVSSHSSRSVSSGEMLDRTDNCNDDKRSSVGSNCRRSLEPTLDEEEEEAIQTEFSFLMAMEQETRRRSEALAAERARLDALEHELAGRRRRISEIEVETPPPSDDAITPTLLAASAAYGNDHYVMTSSMLDGSETNEVCGDRPPAEEDATTPTMAPEISWEPATPTLPKALSSEGVASPPQIDDVSFMRPSAAPGIHPLDRVISFTSTIDSTFSRDDIVSPPASIEDGLDNDSNVHLTVHSCEDALSMTSESSSWLVT